MSSEPRARRLWKRDGSMNVMGLESAIENIFRNGADKKLKALGRNAIQSQLRAGVAIETPLAVFAMLAP